MSEKKHRHKNGNKSKKCGCPRRRWAKCAHPYHVRIRRGRLHRGPLNQLMGLPRGQWLSETEADTLVHKLIVMIDEGKCPCRRCRPQGTPVVAAPADTRLTLRELFARRVAEIAGDRSVRPHRIKVREKAYGVISETPITIGGNRVLMGDMAVADVTTAHLDAFRDARRAILRENEAKRDERRALVAKGDPKARALPISAQTGRGRNGEIGINRQLELLRNAFNWGIRKGYRDGENPFHRHGQRVIQFAKKQSRNRRLQHGERERLIANAVPHLQALIIAAYETGGRRGELLSLQWRDVRFDAKGVPTLIVFRAENTKTNQERTIPVSPALRAALEMRRHAPDGEPHPPTAYVFGDDDGSRFDSIKRSWKTACHKAGITGLNFHDLRREFGSRLLEGGVDLLTVSRALGHSSVTTTNTYLHADKTQVVDTLVQFQQRQTPPKRNRKTAAARVN